MSAAWSASFRNLELAVRQSGAGYSWGVTDVTTRAVIAQGEAVDLEGAMVDAAQAAQADWGTVKWRGPEEDEED